MRQKIKATSWQTLLEGIYQMLDAEGIAEARRHAEWMVMEVLACNRAQLYAYPDREATPAQMQAVAAMAVRRVQHEPLQYILGHADFYGLTLCVTPDVLIPRPETEQVVEAALDVIREVETPKILDIGTGSGCISLALKHERPDAMVYACDVSEAALSVATDNAAANQLAVAFFQADVLAVDFAKQTLRDLDLIISNPPYIAFDEASELASEVRDYEPSLALFAGEDSLRFYRAIAVHAGGLLVPSGHLVFETHAYHAEAVCALLIEAGFADVCSAKDLAGHPRIVQARCSSG